MCLVGIGVTDTAVDVEYCAKKISNIRLFDGEPRPVDAEPVITPMSPPSECASPMFMPPSAVVVAETPVDPGSPVSPTPGGVALSAADVVVPAEVSSPAAGTLVRGKAWARNVVEAGGSVLLVSQFTLCHVLKGNKPDFHNAMPGPQAQPLFDELVKQVRASFAKNAPKAESPESVATFLAEKVQTGSFGAHMHVALVNDGPVTITLDSQNKDK